jgi:hypothetical protein
MAAAWHVTALVDRADVASQSLLPAPLVDDNQCRAARQAAHL